jgi:hypothetical protein
LPEQIDFHGMTREEVPGQNGVIKQLTGRILRRALECEMDPHPGCQKYDSAGDNTRDSRNGYTKKAVLTGNQEAVVRVPRDRNGTFEPRIIPKYQKHVPLFNDRIITGSLRENMAYDETRDEYTCGNNKTLRAVGTETRVSKSGYESEVTVYACGNCGGRPLRERCRASKKNRETGVSKKPAAFREASRVNITSEEGILLRVNPSIQAEGAFGVAKEDGRFRRFMSRGKAGVRGELSALLWLQCEQTAPQDTTGAVR